MKGIDVSKYNAGLNYGKLKADGIDFVMIRAGFGCKSDVRFIEHIKAAKSAKMLVGVYWFAYALNAAEARREAEACERVIRSYKLDLPVFYDFEYDTERYANEHSVTYTTASRTEIIEAFCERIKELGYTAGVYINPDYCLYRTDRTVLNKYKLWIAAWKRADGVSSFTEVKADMLPTAYKEAMIWQFGKSKLNGTHGMYVDVNYGYFDCKQSDTYEVGSKYTIKAGDKYSNGVAVPARLVGKSFTIMQVKDDRILLGEISSWVKI